MNLACQTLEPRVFDYPELSTNFLGPEHHTRPHGRRIIYSLEGLMLKLQYFGQQMRRADSLEKTLMLGKTEGRRRG